MPAVHDRGGLPTDELIDRAEHEWADWEHVTNALVGVLRRHGLINVDELRRGIESMGSEEYLSSSYYERWSASIETLLVEKGVLSKGEIDAAAATLDARWGSSGTRTSTNDRSRPPSRPFAGTATDSEIR